MSDPDDPKTFLHNDMHCSYCDHVLWFTSAVDEDGTPPEPGNSTVCVYCGEFSIIDINPFGQVTARKPNEAEQARVQGSKRLKKAFAKAKAFIREHPPPD